MSAKQENLAALVAWLDAMRRADLDALSELYAPDVVWRGAPAGAICHNRREVRAMLAARIEEGFESTEALELTAGENTVVLGVRSPPCGRSARNPSAVSSSTSSRSPTAASWRSRTSRRERRRCGSRACGRSGVRNPRRRPGRP